MDKTDDYIQRINRAIDYIELNLGNPIHLDKLSDIACLSKYHFHRVFSSFTNESLYSFVIRLRIERAAALLLTQNKSITEIAFSCGFNDSASFSRDFKNHFKISATEWRKRKNSKIHQAFNLKSPYSTNMTIRVNNKTIPLLVEQKDLPDLHVAYIRHRGSFAGDSRLFLILHKKLLKWAITTNLTNYPQTKDLIIYHDSLDITEEERLRISVGITIPQKITGGGEIGCLTIKKATYLVSRFEVRNNEYSQAWKEVFSVILPQKELQPDDGYCFEQYPPNCYNKDKKTTIVDIYVPIKRLI